MELSASQMAAMSRLLDEALPLDTAARRAWLEELSPEYADIAPALWAALLPAQALGARPLGTLPKLLADQPSGGRARCRQAGTRVGPYELIRALGAGGMAEVWLARRADGAIKRTVALKMPTLALVRSELEQRFARERDILASLEHPHIARLYDAGIDPDRQPYLAMEYVEGQPLTDWCDAHRLPVAARLELCLQVLEAMQYAHDRHVVHRDLKPSNILVTDSGQVRLLDFGVAKLLEEEADQAQLTSVYGRALTPDYASPELLRGARLDARCDIYSFGVVLYELLTGTRPYQLKSAGSVGLLEQAIASVVVEEPSVRAEPQAAALRAATPEGLGRQLRGDLDAIAVKTLAKEPAERYPSAADLAKDLRSYLERRPVAARPARLVYRLRKFVRRNRTVVAVSTAAAAAVLAAFAYVLYREVTHTSGASSVTVSAASVPEKSIAVLPFVNISSDKEQEYFSDGLSEELIDHLVHSTGLKVIARSSSFQFKGKNEDVRSIAHQLAVTHVLEGSVRRDGQQLRISAQLIRASDGVSLWAHTYDRALLEIFRVQDEIAEQVSQALRVAMQSGYQRENQRPDIRAYNLVLEGNYFKARRTLPDIEKAAQLYQQAIDITPGYALAWARLASAFFNLEEAKGTPSAEDNAKILDALDRAIRLDPNLIWAYYTRAGFEMTIKWDWAAAQRDHERMRALSTGNTYLLPSALGDMALVSGRVAEAVEQYERMIELNPLDPFSLRALGVALCTADRLPECLRYRLKLQQLHPDVRGVNSFVGIARLYVGQLSEALDAMEKEPEEDLRLAGLAMVYTAMGKRYESDAALRTLEERFALHNAYEIAQIYAYRGEADAAFAWLQRSYQMHSSKIIFIKTDPMLRNLRGDRRFQTLVVKLNLPD